MQHVGGEDGVLVCENRAPYLCKGHPEGALLNRLARARAWFGHCRHDNCLAREPDYLARDLNLAFDDDGLNYKLALDQHFFLDDDSLDDGLAGYGYFFLDDDSLDDGLARYLFLDNYGLYDGFDRIGPTRDCGDAPIWCSWT